ncbi:MAG: response regulator transcription factor [Bacteroidales bacterium]|nr:response regulator transcription factor [Bacteroidales bacterium]
MRALIIEDEILAAKHLRHVIDEVGGIDVLAVTESITESVEWFRKYPQPDLIFMDIHLADGSAFEIFRHISVSCPIIFTTAYDEYALKAFKVNSIDYLLKPIDAASVKGAIRKLELLSPKNSSQDDFKKFIDTFTKGLTYKSHFLIPAKGDKLIPVQSAEIAYIYIDSGTVKAVKFDEKSFRFEYTLDELAELLDPADFFRANRQYIISRKAIKDIDLWFNSRLSVNLKLTAPEKILISKARIPEFKNWFGGN